MIIIEVIEESGLGALGGLLVLILVICLLVNSCNGSAATTTDKVDHVETVETVATIPEVASLTSLHILGTHSNVLDNIENGSVKDAYGKTYTGPFFDLCSYGNYAGEIDTQAYTDLVVGGHYRYLSGTFFARAEQNEAYKIEFFIYADDELVFSSGPIDRRTKPIDFTVDIGNCEIIRIMSSSTDYTCFNTNPGIELVNARVHN